MSYIFIEQKAPPVGKRKIPGTVLAKMNAGIHVHINTDTTLRVQHILKEYGPAGKEAFANGLNKLKNRLPIETTRKATLLLQQENFTEFIYTMLDYYDETAMYNPIKKPDIIVNINNEKPDDTLHNLLESLKQSDIHIIF